MEFKKGDYIIIKKDLEPLVPKNTWGIIMDLNWDTDELHRLRHRVKIFGSPNYISWFTIPGKYMKHCYQLPFLFE